MANRVVSFAVLAVLTFAPTDSQAQNSVANTAARSSTLTPKLMSKISQLIADHGVDRELWANYANALGLAAAGHTWPYRGITATATTNDDAKHAFGVSRGGDRDVVIAVNRQGSLHVFRIHRDGKIVMAIVAVVQTGQITKRSAVDAQKELDAEIAFWSANAGELIANQQWSWCTAQPGGANAISPDLRIRGCTSRIESAEETPRKVALAYVNRGRAYGMKRDKDAASNDFDQAVKIDPSFAQAWSASCSFYMWSRHDSDRAARECSTAIKLDPKDASGWTFRGDIYLNLRDYERAIQDYNQAIEISPTWMWPWDNRGEAYLRSNNIDRAIQDFEQVIKLAPDYAMGYLDRGMAYIRKKQLDLALADFETGLKVDPKSASSLFGRGVVKRLKGDRAGGDADIASARAMNSDAAELFEKNGVEVP